jgi:hypothetical protein
MTNYPDWLPEIVLFADYENDWEKYEKALYAFYCRDFVDSKPEFRGEKLAVKRHPIEQSKEATFWHIISEGKIEDERLPDFRRCERIRWPAPIIENVDDQDYTIKVWENTRHRGEKRICIWFEAFEYLVILAKRKDYTLFWTAYPVTRNHRKRKLQREFEASKKS